MTNSLKPRKRIDFDTIQMQIDVARSSKYVPYRFENMKETHNTTKNLANCPYKKYIMKSWRKHKYCRLDNITKYLD